MMHDSDLEGSLSGVFAHNVEGTMGWTSGPKAVGVSALDFIKQRLWTAEYLAENEAEIVAEVALSSVIYIAMKLHKPDEGEFVARVFEADIYDGSITFAVVYLVEGDIGSSSIAYKPMDETMGPYCDSRCPAGFIAKLSDIKPDAPGYSAAWRQRQQVAA